MARPKKVEVEKVKEKVKEVTPEFECANCEDSGRACYKCGKEN